MGSALVSKYFFLLSGEKRFLDGANQGKRGQFLILAFVCLESCFAAPSNPLQAALRLFGEVEVPTEEEAPGAPNRS